MTERKPDMAQSRTEPARRHGKEMEINWSNSSAKRYLILHKYMIIEMHLYNFWGIRLGFSTLWDEWKRKSIFKIIKIESWNDDVSTNTVSDIPEEEEEEL